MKTRKRRALDRRGTSNDRADDDRKLHEHGKTKGGRIRLKRRPGLIPRAFVFR